MSRDHDVYIVARATAQGLLSSQSIYLPAPPLRPLLRGALSLCEISLPVTQSITAGCSSFRNRLISIYDIGYKWPHTGKIELILRINLLEKPVFPLERIVLEVSLHTNLV